MAKIADLLVQLTVETASFRRDLNTAQKTVKDFGDGLTGTFGKLQGLVTGGLQAFGVAMAVDFVKSTTAGIDSLGKLSQKIGISIDDLSSLQHAAALADVPIETFATGIGLLSKAMAGFTNDENKGASAALQNIGVNARDANGALRPTKDVLADIANAFAGMEDGAQKTSLAIQLFGRSGKELIPLLNGGANGIREMQAEANALGLQLDEKTAKAAERFHDNLTRLESASKGLAQTLVSQLLPSLDRITDGLVEAAKSGDRFNSIQSIGKALDFVLAALSTIVSTLRIAIDYVGKFFGAIGAAARLIAKGDFAGLAALDERLRKEFLDPFRDFSTEVSGIWGTAMNGIQQSTDSTVSLVDKRINAVLFGIRSAKTEIAALSASKEITAIKAAQAEYAQNISQLSALWVDAGNRRIEIEQAVFDAIKIRDAKIVEATKESTAKRIAEAKKYAEDLRRAEEELQKIAREGILSGASEIDEPFVKASESLNEHIQKIETALAKFPELVTKGPQRIGGAVVASINDYLNQIDRIGDEAKKKADEIIGQLGELNKIDVRNVPIVTPTTLPVLVGNDFYTNFIRSLTANKKTIQKELDDLLGVQQFKASIDEIVLETGRASAGVGVFFRQYADYATNAAKVVHDAFARAFSALEDQLTNLLAHLKFDFKSLLDTIKESIARAVVQKFILGPLAKSLGNIFGLNLQKADGSKDNPFHVVVENGGIPGIGGGAAGESGPLSGDAKDGSGGILGKIQATMGKVFSAIGSFFASIGSAIASVFKSVIGAIGHAFGGFFAAGGDLSPNTWNIVGENGPEIIRTGNVTGRVFPNHVAFGGNSKTNNITNNFYLSPTRSDPYGYSSSQIANAVFTGQMRSLSRA